MAILVPYSIVYQDKHPIFAHPHSPSIHVLTTMKHKIAVKYYHCVFVINTSRYNEMPAVGDREAGGHAVLKGQYQ